MSKDRFIIFPTLLNTNQKVLYSVRIFESIEPRSVDKFVVESLSGHIVLNFEFFLNDVGFGESVGKSCSFIDFVEKVVIETVDVEGLSLVRLLIFDSLLQLLEELFDELIRIIWEIVADEVLL